MSSPPLFFFLIFKNKIAWKSSSRSRSDSAGNLWSSAIFVTFLAYDRIFLILEHCHRKCVRVPGCQNVSLRRIYISKQCAGAVHWVLCCGFKLLQFHFLIHLAEHRAAFCSSCGRTPKPHPQLCLLRTGVQKGRQQSCFAGSFSAGVDSCKSIQAIVIMWILWRLRIRSCSLCFSMEAALEMVVLF